MKYRESVWTGLSAKSYSAKQSTLRSTNRADHQSNKSQKKGGKTTCSRTPQTSGKGFRELTPASHSSLLILPTPQHTEHNTSTSSFPSGLTNATSAFQRKRNTPRAHQTTRVERMWIHRLSLYHLLGIHIITLQLHLARSMKALTRINRAHLLNRRQAWAQLPPSVLANVSPGGPRRGALHRSSRHSTSSLPLVPSSPPSPCVNPGGGGRAHFLPGAS